MVVAYQIREGEVNVQQRKKAQIQPSERYRRGYPFDGGARTRILLFAMESLYPLSYVVLRSAEADREYTYQKIPLKARGFEGAPAEHADEI